MKFGKLVEKQHAVVREGNFAGLGIRPSAYQPDLRNSVVRRAKRALKPAGLAPARKARGGIYAEYLQKLLHRRRRHY